VEAMTFLRKLLRGSSPESLHNHATVESPLQKKISNIKAIWNNDHKDDIGLEKMVRLFLASSPLIFLGTYIKQIFGRKSEISRNLSIEIFVVFKSIFPILLLYFGLQNNLILVGIVIWFLAETMLYVPTLIFASDLFTRPRSYGRSMLLLFFNYLEITFSFALLYAYDNGMNVPFKHWYDSLYFSCITSSTIGYGDYYPVEILSKFLVSLQSIVLVLFVVLFLNFFSGKMDNKGYFGK
jgi:hypothetical protein